MTADERYRFWITLERLEDMITAKNIRGALRLIDSEKRELECADNDDD